MNKFVKMLKSQIANRKANLVLKLSEARETENLYMNKFQELLKYNKNFDGNAAGISQQIKYILNTDFNEKIQMNQENEEKYILGKNLFNDFSLIREKINEKIYLVNSKQNELKLREIIFDNKFNKITDEQKKIFNFLINTENFDYETLKNSSTKAIVKTNILDNLDYNKNDEESKNDLNQTHSLIGETSMLFQRLKKEHFFEKICLTDINSKNIQNNEVIFDYLNKNNHLITDPISLKNNPFSLNQHCSNGLIKSLKKDEKKKHSNNSFKGNLNIPRSNIVKNKENKQINKVLDKNSNSKEKLVKDIDNNNSLRNFYNNKAENEKYIYKRSHDDKGISPRKYNSPNIVKICIIYDNVSRMEINHFDERIYSSHGNEIQEKKLDEIFLSRYVFDCKSLNLLKKRRIRTCSNFRRSNNLNTLYNISDDDSGKNIQQKDYIKYLSGFNKLENKRSSKSISKNESSSNKKLNDDVEYKHIQRLCCEKKNEIEEKLKNECQKKIQLKKLNKNKNQIINSKRISKAFSDKYSINENDNINRCKIKNQENKIIRLNKHKLNESQKNENIIELDSLDICAIQSANANTISRIVKNDGKYEDFCFLDNSINLENKHNQRSSRCLNRNILRNKSEGLCKGLNQKDSILNENNKYNLSNSPINRKKRNVNFDFKDIIYQNYKGKKINEKKNSKIFLEASFANDSYKKDNFDYIKSRYECINKNKKNKEVDFLPVINKINMKINITPVYNKVSHFGMKSIQKIKEIKIQDSNEELKNHPIYHHP